MDVYKKEVFFEEICIQNFDNTTRRDECNHLL